MNYFHTTLLAALTALLLTGCDMSEDYQNCPSTRNVSLNFSLLDKAGAQVFAENIDKTDLILFRDGHYHSNHNILTTSLGPDRSIALTLDPGTYSVVSWGNIGSKTTMTDIGDIYLPGDGQLTYDHAEGGCDPLFYAPAAALGLTRSFNPNNELTTFTVPAEGEVNETIRFTHAHNKLDIYVKGYAGGAQHPIIEIEGVGRGFDFYLNDTGGSPSTASQQSVSKTTEEGVMSNAIFSIARIQAENAINIHIVDPDTNERVWTAALNDIIETFEDFDLEVEIRIPILFEYYDGRFTVKMPEWEKQNMKPGLD